MKKIITILLFFLCFCAVTFAQDLQEFSVVKFEEKPFDTSGKDERYKLQDGNGELFSIIKLLAATPDDDLSAYSLDFGYCEGRKKVVNGEVWWYVQRNAMRATIQREGFKQVKYELNATVQPGKVYEMTLQATPRVAKKRMLLFEVSPADSRAQVTYKAEGESDYKVFGDGMVDDGGMVADRLELGVYHYRIISKNYHPSEGRIELYDAPQKHTEKVTLRPNYGTLTLKAAAGAGIYIDGEKVGTGQWSGILSPGNYNVECQFPAHKNTVKTITVNEGDNLTVQLDAPTPITGTLSLKSSPLGATVIIDGKELGTTPEDFAGLLIGKHKITVSKSGYKSVSVDVEIKEGEVAEHSVVLEKELTAEEFYSKGMSACYAGNYSDGAKWLLKAADQGHADAQYNLGVCYSDGYGVVQSASEAVKWYRKAADQGHALAQFNLGNFYYDGRDVAQSYSEAVKWFRKAADQGLAHAQCNLGVCYQNGEGVAQSYSEAVKLYRKAAEQGYAQAQSNLGVCYQNGYAVVQSASEAVKWYRKAAEQGNACAQYNLGGCYEDGKGVTQSTSEAVKWYRKAAEQGFANAKDALTRLGY